MGITPERALELANKMKPGNDGYTIPSASEAMEIAAILSHYAEIAPKWQSVLDAEPVKTTCFGAQLIRKPAQ